MKAGHQHMRQSESARSMGKSGGEKMRTPRQGHSRAGKQTQAEAEIGDAEGLRREAERLREELAVERQRTEKLEAATVTVASRLDAAIASIRQLLDRRG
jgi:hypothetical protein